MKTVATGGKVGSVENDTSLRSELDRRSDPLLFAFGGDYQEDKRVLRRGLIGGAPRGDDRVFRLKARLRTKFGGDHRTTGCEMVTCVLAA